MYKNSINGAIKKGLGAAAASDRQASSALEQSRKRREEFIQKKRSRVESMSSNDLRNNASNQTDITRLNEYAAIILTEAPENAVEAVKHMRRLLSQKDGIYVDDVISTGVIPRFVYFLSFHNLPKLQFEAVWALTNVACGTSQQTSSVVQAGAIEPLLHLLSSPQLEVQEQSVWALGNIAGDCDEYREYILRLDGFGMIVRLAQSNIDKFGIVRNCIWCLSNLCRYQQNKEFMFSYVQPFLPFLQQIMQYNKIEVVTDACWAFSFLTDASPEQKKQVMCYIKPYDILRCILINNTNLQCPALRVAGNIVSGDRDDTQKMLDAGLVRVLLKILPNAKDIQKKEILWIISNIAAGTPQQIQTLIDNGLIKDLILIINTEIDILQVEALWAISNAINGGNEEQIRYIVEKQVIPPLVRLLPKVSHIVLKRHILVSLYRILKVGDCMKTHCKMEKNPYLDFFLEEGGDERVNECTAINNKEIQEICAHILKRCVVQENTEDIPLPNI